MAKERGFSEKVSDAAAAAAFFLLAAGFAALLVWSLRHGIAGAKFGAAERSSEPGTFWFFLSLQVFMALAFLARGIMIYKPDLRARRWAAAGLVVVLGLGAWMLVERAAAFYADIAGRADLGERLIEGGLALMLLGVIVTLLYQLVWLEIKDQLARSRSGRG